jgi:hypothetical protein
MSEEGLGPRISVWAADAEQLVLAVSFPGRRLSVAQLQELIDARERVSAALRENRDA